MTLYELDHVFHSVFTELLKRVLGNVDLNLAAELHLLLQNNRGTLGDFRDLITGKWK